jgi:DnaJ-domain-containing protein 1
VQPQARTLHVRCSTWEQVEVFHSRKLRRGRILSMKVPFSTEIGAPVTLGLELPNGLVIAIDGNVIKASPLEDGKSDGKTWIEVELIGLTPDVLTRIKAMAAGTEIVPPPPVAAPRGKPITGPPKEEELPADERQLFQHLSAELRRMRAQAVHEVLGVARDAEADAIRRGWMNLVRRHHPDLVARHNAPAISHLAEELTILCNRAYDRLRAALVTEGRGQAFGPAITSPPGWLIGFEDISSSDHMSRSPSTRIPVPQTASGTIETGPQASTLQGGEAFEVRARAMLGDGDAGNAQEVLAAALVVYPRSRPLRSLYYIASALAALDNGELMLATSQLETAIAHNEDCTEAAVILDHIRKHGTKKTDELRRLFR